MSISIAKRSRACASVSTCIFPRPNIALASVRDMNLRNCVHAALCAQFTTHGLRLDRIKNEFVASSRVKGRNTAERSG